MGHRLAWRGPKRRPWTDHVEVHTACSARRGATSDGRWLDGPWEGVLRAHPWPSAHLPDTVQGTRSQRGGRMMKMRSSTSVKVPVLRVGEQLRDLAKLLDLRMGREEG
jgi:hypothetical protein